MGARLSLLRLLIAPAAIWGIGAAQAQAAEPITLRPGEAVTVLIDDGGRVTTAANKPALPMSAYDRAAVEDLLVNHPEAYGVSSAVLDAGEPPPIASGEVRISLRILPGKEEATLLILENGYGQGFKYRAAMRQNGRSQPTDVCVVRPWHRSYEHWPYRIDRLDLSGLILVPLRPDQPATCE